MRRLRRAPVALLALLLACGAPDELLGETGSTSHPPATRAAPEPPVVEDVPSAAEPASAQGGVLFLGTSLTAGQGVPEEQAFPALIQAKIDAEGLPFRVINAGVSGDTSAGGLTRLDWLLRQPIDVLVLELGANDMLRGQDIESMDANLQEIIERTRARHKDVRVLVAGMQAAPNLGRRYGDAYARTFEGLARDNDAVLIPFLLEGVAGQASLNQPDGIHPTAAGHRILAETVWSHLGPLLSDLARTRD
jgi:acyl-CoA thioesterase-1